VEPFSNPPPSHRLSAELYCLCNQFVFIRESVELGLIAMDLDDQLTEPQSQLRVDATGMGGCGVRVMYGSGWGYGANKPKAIVQIDILIIKAITAIISLYTVL